MTLKRQQEFETWLVQKIDGFKIELSGASPTGLEAHRMALNWLEAARSKFLELTEPPAPEPPPKPAPAVHVAVRPAVRPPPKAKGKNRR